MLSRRVFLAGAAACAPGACISPSKRPASANAFVSVRDGKFMRAGKPYRYVGANMWYGAYLASTDSERLKRELDRLTALGVRNIRVLGASELSPLNHSLRPAFHDSAGANNEALLRGLDTLLAEMARRDMTAVIYLNNFWEWSGGMATYLAWTNGGQFINMGDPAHPWPEFADFSAHFYSEQRAVALANTYLRALVTRTNTITGNHYADDPTIMAWQLANEPRPGGSEAFGASNRPAYFAWVDATARLIKSLDPNHLVSTGSEGAKGCMEDVTCVRRAHASADVDYVTAHIWPQNWSWVDPHDLNGTYARAEANTRDYIETHVALARDLAKPLVIEEFGFPRDDTGYAPGSPTTLKDRFYRIIQESVAGQARMGGPLSGSNFWAWGGEGRALHDDRQMRPGETAYVGDPPHEPQGWYSVFDADVSTCALITQQARALAALT